MDTRQWLGQVICPQPGQVSLKRKRFDEDQQRYKWSTSAVVKLRAGEATLREAMLVARDRAGEAHGPAAAAEAARQAPLGRAPKS